MTGRIPFTSLAALLAILSAALACSPVMTPPGLPSGPVRIGLITSLTGIDLPLGLDVRQGAEQAVNEVNADGGIAGHPVALEVGDDAGTGDQAVAAFSALKAQHVAGIAGPLSAEGELAIVPLAASSHLPLLSTSGADPVTRTGGRLLDNVFLAAPAASRSAERMLRYARDASLTAVAIAHPAGDPFADAGVATLRVRAPKYGLRVVTDQAFGPGTVDFQPLIEAVRSSGARVLLVWGAGAGPPLLERAWKVSGLGIPILLSPASASTAFLRAVSDSGEGAQVVASTSLLAASLPPGAAAHRQVGPMAAAFQRHNGYYPTQAAFDGYAAVRLLLRAIADAGSTDPDAVDAALARLVLATASGTFRYSSHDHLGLAADWLAIATVRAGVLAPAG